MRTRFATAEVKAVEDDSPNGGFEVVLSAPTVDRDGEVIDARAFEPLPDHITFDIDHGLSTATTVGSGKPRYDGDLLKVSGTFSSIPRAQEVRTLINEGHIRTTSVAFMEPRREVIDGVPHIVKAELLNGAFVPVPSNREAAVLMAKALGGERARKALAGSYEERRESVVDAVRVAYPDAMWAGVLATFDDVVVFEVETFDGVQQYQAPYEISDGVLTLGSAEEVEVTEVVTPVKSADPEKAAAPAAASPASVSMARLAAMRAQADLLID